MAYNMNPQRGRHLEGEGSAEHGESHSAGEHKSAGHGHKPHIFIHSHSAGHTVHIHHPDGRHEMHEHPHGDTDNIAGHIHEQLGGGESGGLDEDGDNDNEYGM